jgi:hypothetical protein
VIAALVPAFAPVLDHVLPFAWLEVKTIEPPEQNVVGPFAEIVGVDGVAPTVIIFVCVMVLLPHWFVAVKVTLYVPGVL